ncbi:MAG: PilN domain-containing protein [Phycisphaeraceae bacterium]
MAKNMSFLPEDYLEKRTQRRTNVICLALFVVVMSGVIGAFFVTDAQSSELRTREIGVNQRFEEAARRIEQFEQLQKSKQAMLRKAKITSVLIERVPRSIVLAELINNMPTTLSLLEMELETRVIKPRRASGVARTALDRAKRAAAKAAPDIPEIKPTEVKITLVGAAPTDVEVAQYMTALSRSALFENVNLLFSEQTMIEEQQMRKFRIDLMVNQNIDPQNLSPKMVRRVLQQDPMNQKIQIGTDGMLVVPTEPEEGASVVPVSDATQNNR